MNEYEHEFIEGVRDAVNYWRREGSSFETALPGLAHSILCVLDGVAGQECSYDLIRRGDGSSPDVIVSAMFHELLYRDGWS